MFIINLANEKYHLMIYYLNTITNLIILSIFGIVLKNELKKTRIIF